MAKRVGIYIRVSTDGQTTANQRRELEAVAARSGWEVVGIYEDAGISGSNGRDKRPGFDQLKARYGHSESGPDARCRHQRRPACPRADSPIKCGLNRPPASSRRDRPFAAIEIC